MLERRRSLSARGNHDGSADASGSGGTGAIAPAAVAAGGRIVNDPHGVFSLKMPAGWMNRSANGEMKFFVYAPDGRAAGQATLAPVSTASSAPASQRAMRQRLGGVPFSDLRRTVIDKMINADGWVKNDFEQQVGDRRVYVVVAETPISQDGRVPQQAWTFYFTEMDGRIYALAANSSLEFTDQVATGSEQVLASMHGINHTAMVGRPKQ